MILDGHTLVSTTINQNLYIFQTYAYSIENLQCYKESLQSVCVRATKNSKKKVNLSKLLKLYSNIIYPLLLWSLYFASKKDTTTFKITDFSKIVKILTIVDIDTQCEAAILDVQQRVQAKITELGQNHSSEIQQVAVLSQKLRSSNLNEDTAYLFMNGHTLFDNVVLMILKPLCRKLRKKKRQEISANAQHQEELRTQTDHYIKKVKKDGEKEVLATNTDFKPCLLYQKIKQDLNLYIQNFN